MSRGSVLIFTVVVLAILAMLGTTYMLIVTQSRQAASNIIRTSEADAALQSGLSHATILLRKSVSEPSIVTPEGVFDPDLTQHPNYVNNAQGGTPLATNSFTFFESNLATDNTSAILYWDPQKVYNDSADIFVANIIPRFYTTSPLATSAYPTGQARPANGYTHDGSARAFQLASTSATGFSEFYAVNPAIKALPPIGTERGLYYVWISDLDAKLYAVTQDWGLDTIGTLTPSTMGYADNSGWELDIQRSVLNQPTATGQPVAAPYLGINNFGSTGSISAATSWNYANTTYHGPGLTDQDLKVLTDLQPGTPLMSSQDLSMQLPSLNGTTTVNPMTQAAFDYYLTVYRDIPDPVANKPYLFVKDHAAAININTATVEVIAAALSQIPADKDGQTLGSDVTIPNRPWNIAKRIVAKRPFLCRMDFEDFLAAQIASSLTNPPTDIPSDSDYYADDPSLWTSAEPVVIIYYSIGRRLGPILSGTQILQGRWPEVIPNNSNLQVGVALNLTTPELTLSQYLEIPGSSDTPDPDDKLSYYSGVNTPAFQKARFRYFFADSTDALHSTGVITPKEFNNIINSVTSIGDPHWSNGKFVRNDDKQLVPVGMTVPADSIVIDTGANGILETQPLGDNYILKVIKPGGITIPVGDDVLNADGTISPGPNHILDTVPDPSKGDQVIVKGIAAGLNGKCYSFTPNNRPSYYSYSNDQSYENYFWTQINAAIADYANKNQTSLTDAFYKATTITDQSLSAVMFDFNAATPSTTLPLAEANATKYFKLYYRIPIAGDLTNKQAPVWVAASPDDLISWRCIPSIPPAMSPSVAPIRSAGLYQMAVTNGAPATGPDWHPHYDIALSSTGDPNDSKNTFSSASMTSGRPTFDGVPAYGDVAWSPQFAFRSRYFGIYVLASGLLQGNNGSNSKEVGERRMEAVYDALQDTIVWRRIQASNKRALGNPSQPGDP